MGKSQTENDKTSDKKVVPEEEGKIQKKQLPKEVAKRFSYYNIIHKLGNRWLSSQSQSKKNKKNFQRLLTKGTKCSMIMIVIIIKV